MKQVLLRLVLLWELVKPMTVRFYELRDSAHVHNNKHWSRDDIESLHSALHEVPQERTTQLLSHNDELERVCNEHDILSSNKAELESCLSEVSAEEIKRLKAELKKQTEKAK